jgi:hypothetical protein
MSDADLEVLTTKLRSATALGRLSHGEALEAVKFLLTYFVPPTPPAPLPGAA